MPACSERCDVVLLFLSILAVPLLVMLVAFKQGVGADLSDRSWTLVFIPAFLMAATTTCYTGKRLIDRGFTIAQVFILTWLMACGWVIAIVGALYILGAVHSLVGIYIPFISACSILVSQVPKVLATCFFSAVAASQPAGEYKKERPFALPV